MKKIKNPYKNCHIMDLNLMEISYNKKIRITSTEAILMIIPVILCVTALIISTMPELGFLAECKNIPGGDICNISIK